VVMAPVVIQSLHNVYFGSVVVPSMSVKALAT
jgi:hypothetical protein